MSAGNSEARGLPYWQCLDHIHIYISWLTSYFPHMVSGSFWLFQMPGFPVILYGLLPCLLGSAWHFDVKYPDGSAVVGGWGGSKVVATFNHVGGSFNLFMAATGNVWIIPSLRIWDYVLHVEHFSCVIKNCGQHQGVIPSPLSIVLLGFAVWKHYQKIIITIFRLVLQNFAILGCFPYIIFYRYFCSLLSSGGFVIAVCGSISVQGTS